MPHRHKHVLATWHKAGTKEVTQAIQAALKAHKEWSSWKFEDRAAIFLRAAELLATVRRDKVNAATMLNQSKTAHQSEIDAVCEAIDFLRFNVHLRRGSIATSHSRRRHVESDGLPPIGRICLCRHAIQLHRYCQQSSVRARADGKHGDVEVRELDGIQQLPNG